jgi:uncharacterized protein (TIGR02145 family)
MANITGVVTDTGSTPIAGAIVKLETGGWTATTAADGSFTLGPATGTLPNSGKLLPKGLSAGITGTMMTLTIAERSAVEIAAFDLNGKALSSVRQTMDAGSHSIALPQRSAGVYLYKVKSGNGELLLKGNSVGGATSASALSTQGFSSSKLAKAATTINDIIAVTKTGCLNYRCVQYTSDTTGLKIKMIANAGNVTDTDGNVYQTVRIGGQVWTVENLRVTRYRDGSAISLDTSTATWASDNVATTPMFCYYSNTTNADSIKKYGALYNWYVVSPANLKKIAPAGWHVPTESEWEVMQRYLVMHGYNYDGTTDTMTTNKIAMALAAKTDWSSSKGAGLPGNNLTKNNSSGFSALPGGGRKGSSTVFIPGGTFWAQDSTGYWWSATGTDVSSTWISLYYGNNDLSISGINFKNYGFSVRLVRDSI